ncbi:MAG: glycoside hydrolase family 16 protein [Muribaculaceae bacterium]|nr:glycoside hydrolase family 16 protein [Muribaculaceae bacterium]
MNRIYVLTIMLLLFVFNANADYCNRTTNSNSSRYLKSVSFQGGYYEFSPLSIATSGYSAIYYNKTSKVFYANAGSTITPQIDYEGAWMQGYVYIDYDNDGTFNTTNELVAYSGYMQNGVWRNSKGEQIADGGVCPPSTVPSFIIPESMPSGDYRMRVKVDWDSPDPCGRTSATGNSMEQNGGAIVDLTLRLSGVTHNYTITIDNQYTKEYILEWSDEFEERQLDERVWSKIEPYESGNPDWRKNISTYDGCFDFRDGNIVLRGIRNPGEAETLDTRTYLCGGIESWGKKSFKDGRVEIRAKTTSARGAWPALWMMPEDQSAGWPGCGEIDIFEHLNYDSFVYQTLHSNYTYNVNKENPLSHITASVDVSDYNVYGVELASDTIKLMLNDNVTMAYPNIGATDQFPYSKEFYLILDMQLGGSWVGSVTGENLPVEMYLDWVRFYKRYETGGKLLVKTLENKVISSGETVPENTVLLITATPIEGYVIESLVVNGVDVTAEHNVSGSYAYCPTTSTTIAATYKPKSASVETVEQEESVVYVANNRIVVVSSKPENVAIYNMSGMVVDKRVVESRIEIERTSGIYIVVVGSKAYKVKL